MLPPPVSSATGPLPGEEVRFPDGKVSDRLNMRGPTDPRDLRDHCDLSDRRPLGDLRDLSDHRARLESHDLLDQSADDASIVHVDRQYTMLPITLL